MKRLFVNDLRQEWQEEKERLSAEAAAQAKAEEEKRNQALAEKLAATAGSSSLQADVSASVTSVTEAALAAVSMVNGDGSATSLPAPADITDSNSQDACGPPAVSFVNDAGPGRPFEETDYSDLNSSLSVTGVPHIAFSPLYGSSLTGAESTASSPEGAVMMVEDS